MLASLVFAAGLGVQSNAMAFEFNPALGVDGGYSVFDFKQNFGKAEYVHDSWNLAAYISNPIWEMIGVELGYQWFNRRDRFVHLNQGEVVFPGSTTSLGAGQDLFLDTYRKFNAPYLGLTFNYQLPNCKPVSLFALLGGAYTHLKAEQKYVGDQNGLTTLAVTNSSTRTFSDSKTVAMIRLGANWMATEQFGFRLYGAWLDTSRVKITSDQVNSSGIPAQVRLNDTYQVGVGAYWTNFM